MKALARSRYARVRNDSGWVRSDRQPPCRGGLSAAGHSFRNTPTIIVFAMTRVGRAKRNPRGEAYRKAQRGHGAELVIGPATSGRTRWRLCHTLRCCSAKLGRIGVARMHSLIRHRAVKRSGGGGPRVCAVEGACGAWASGAADAPSTVLLRRTVPLPRFAGQDGAAGGSRGAYGVIAKEKAGPHPRLWRGLSREGRGPSAGAAKNCQPCVR